MAGVDPARLVFLDETSTPTTLTPLRARAARGHRAHGRIPRGRREAISWLATLTTSGLGESLLVRGAVDRLVFEARLTARGAGRLQVSPANLGMGATARAQSSDRSYGRDMPRRTAFTVLLSVVLVLTTSGQPEASAGASPASATQKTFSVTMDGRSPGAHFRPFSR